MNKTIASSPCAALAVLALLTPLPSRASSVDDSAGRVVVPYVVTEPGFDSRVQVTNHERLPVTVRVFFVGERGGPNPGRRSCTSLALAGREMAAFDVPSQCGLPGAPGVGMVVLLTDIVATERISARALVEARSPATGTVLQTMPVAGLPLANLEGTESFLTAGGLRTVKPLVPTDCFVGALFDGSGRGGMLARVTIEDESGVAVATQATSLKAFELVRFKDVLGSVPSGTTGLQAEFAFSGWNDALVAYCVSTRTSTTGDPTRVVSMAQASDPQDEVRRRSFVADGTPALGPFLMMPGLPVVKHYHGVYVRHPDTVRCSVATSTPGVDLEIAAFSPDRVRTTGVAVSSVEFATDAHGSVAAGTSELWGLEVDYAAGTTIPPGSVPYRISCRSGNGTSLADLLLPQMP